jgi:hypothetical protein
MTIANAIARTAPSTAKRSGSCPVLINIMPVDYLISIAWTTRQEVVWLVLLAA